MIRKNSLANLWKSNQENKSGEKTDKDGASSYHSSSSTKDQCSVASKPIFDNYKIAPMEATRRTSTNLGRTNSLGAMLDSKSTMSHASNNEINVHGNGLTGRASALFSNKIGNRNSISRPPSTRHNNVNMNFRNKSLMKRGNSFSRNDIDRRISKEYDLNRNDKITYLKEAQVSTQQIGTSQTSQNGLQNGSLEKEKQDQNPPPDKKKSISRKSLRKSLKKVFRSEENSYKLTPPTSQAETKSFKFTSESLAAQTERLAINLPKFKFREKSKTAGEK